MLVEFCAFPPIPQKRGMDGAQSLVCSESLSLFPVFLLFPVFPLPHQVFGGFGP